MDRRRRIGLMVPASNTTFEADFGLVVPRDITLHSHRLWISEGIESDESIDKVNEQVEEAARHLARARVEIIAYGFTTGSFYRGAGHCQRLIERIEGVAGVPVVTPATAILDALRHFGARKLSVVTPYPEWNNGRLLAFLEAAGFQVLSFLGDCRPAEVAINAPMWDQDPESVFAVASSARHAAADVLLCACTAWRALEVAERLEQAVGIPVVTANQASIWAVLHQLGILQPIHSFGRLLAAGPSRPVAR